MKKNRLEKVIGNMERMGLDQLVVSDPSSIYYLTGIFIDPGERLFALLVKSDGSATLFNNRLFPLAGQEGLQIVWHSDGEDAIGMLAEAVADGPLGVDKAWPARFLIELMARRGGAKPVLGSAAVDDARMYKDAEEIELMRAASRVNDAAMAEAIAALAPGISESKMVGIIGELHVKHGADAALPPGDSVILDIFAPVNRYWCDMTRTVFYKSATDEQKRVYEIVRQANLAGIAAVAPGVPLRDIDAAARKVIEDAGYGRYFTHRLGHGIGLDVHEPPDCSAVSDAIARPGMCFSIEPGIYLPGQWGVRIEDLVVVTEDGVEVLNSYTKELQIIE